MLKKKGPEPDVLQALSKDEYFHNIYIYIEFYRMGRTRESSNLKFTDPLTYNLHRKIRKLFPNKDPKHLVNFFHDTNLQKLGFLLEHYGSIYLFIYIYIYKHIDISETTSGYKELIGNYQSFGLRQRNLIPPFGVLEYICDPTHAKPKEEVQIIRQEIESEMLVPATKNPNSIDENKDLLEKVENEGVNNAQIRKESSISKKSMDEGSLGNIYIYIYISLYIHNQIYKCRS